MYQTFHSHTRRRGSYFLPFLSLIIFGLIVVLIFLIVGYFQEKRAQALENKAAVKVIAGRSEMKVWGLDQWTTAIDGSILNEGDSIRTSPGSRVILTLLNGSVVRLSSDTEVELTALQTRDAQDSADFSLKNGEIWLKRTEKDTVKADFKVATPHLSVSSLGTIFDVSKGQNEEVRVLDGKVQVDVKVEDPDAANMRTADTLQIALGQQISLGPQEIAQYKDRKPISLIELLADDFRSDDWYVWNRAEDASGGSGLAVADAVAQKTGTSTSVAVVPAQSEAPPVQLSPLSKPEIISPLGDERTIRSGNVLISGSTGGQTKQIEVTTYVGGKAEPYVLQKYSPGSPRWSYVVSREYGNLVEGSNRYTIVAMDKDGKRSDQAEITIVYDKPKEPADLGAPVVLTFNGGTSSVIAGNEALVQGTIGKGIVKIFVNDFSLTRYVPDSKTWNYYAKTVYGNLKDGENSYEIYGVDADGNKTPVTEFKIIKQSAVQQTQAPASQQAPAGRADAPL